jgi:hypothetical protein
LVCSMDDVERFHEAYRAARADPSDEKLLALLEALLPFSPPGVEWGVEVADVAGTTYVLEGGRAVAVRLSRDEFGPFMQTSVAEIPLTSIPSVGLKGLRDVDGFVKRVLNHLSEWSRRMPEGSAQRELVMKLLESFRG